MIIAIRYSHKSFTDFSQQLLNFRLFMRTVFYFLFLLSSTFHISLLLTVFLYNMFETFYILQLVFLDFSSTYQVYIHSQKEIHSLPYVIYIRDYEKVPAIICILFLYDQTEIKTVPVSVAVFSK